MPDGHVSGRTPCLPSDLTPLERWFSERFEAAQVKVRQAELLPGGAVQRNWRLTLDVDGESHVVVLRVGPDMPLPESRTKDQEFAILRDAHAAGVPVAEPLFVEVFENIIGRAFLISAFCAGDADRQKLFTCADNQQLLSELGASLAQVHQMTVPAGVPSETPIERVDTLQSWAGDINHLPPGIQTGLDWLARHVPEPGRSTSVHRDFRTGNFMVRGGHLAALLDWEFAGAGDYHEDIAWFCAACWRGENPSREAGGLGPREEFYRAYVAAGGDVPDPLRIHFWEVFAHVRWSLIAMQQASRAEAGEYPVWELEEAGNRVPGLSEVILKMVNSV